MPDWGSCDVVPCELVVPCEPVLPCELVPDVPEVEPLVWANAAPGPMARAADRMPAVMTCFKYMNNILLCCRACGVSGCVASERQPITEQGGYQSGTAEVARIVLRRHNATH